ncbi:hypothetical protein AAG570_001217 [Ranatra chinensis]|uniref:Uncharacterized protein n=1 Tax=Ranatra chinensis TaxID=642074 RepID=A0ABD0YB84_9HEMI
MGCNQLYSLSWGDFGTSLSSTVQILRGHGDLVDVTLAAGGKIFPAHKLVLSAASPLLMELLKSTQCQHPVVMLAGITATDLEALLQFVYQGEVSVDPNQLPSLLQAAQCLDIQALSPASLSSDVCGGHHEHHGVSRGTMMPCVTVRKRKRKARLTYATVPPNQEPGGPHGDPNQVQVEDAKGPMDDPAIKKPPLISDLPVSCGICGATLRQSRNLRRHMELIHMKTETGMEPVRKRKNKKNAEIPSVDSVKSLSIIIVELISSDCATNYNFYRK